MPRKQVRVRDHKRRKPEQEERIHVNEYTRTLDTVVPRGCEDEFLKARRQFENRSERSKADDLELECKETGLIDDKDFVADWKEEPNRHDIAGVDDPLYGPQLEDLDVVKQSLRERFEKFKRTSGEIVRKAKAKVEAIKKAPKVPAREKRKRVTKVKKQARKELEHAAKKDLKELKKTEGLFHRARRAISKPWSAERRRRAHYVAETVGCSPIEADGLIIRARAKGYDWDVIDWDRLQGKDLAYDERVDRLQQMVGHTYTEKEYEDELKNGEQRWKEHCEMRKEEIARVGERDYKPYVMEDYEIPPDSPEAYT